jgi:ubiquinone/menaquinone biosynthesis C-methylase UbiE
LIKAIYHGRFSRIFSKLVKGRVKRVKDVWKTSSQKQSEWWIIPKVAKHFNYLITGDENVSYYQYISDRYLSGKKDLMGLSLGCGKGGREIRWAKLCDFKKIEAYDISESCIKVAKECSSEEGYSSIIDYHAADIYNVAFRENCYDVVFVEQSLHHFSPLKKLLEKINKCLTLDGYFIVNEFVGPSRFQWTDKQLEIVNSIRSILPSRYRVYALDNSICKKVIRPSRLSMILTDPSEAVESSNIMPLLNKIFDIVEIKPYHGAILHLLFDGIALNFLSQDEQTERYLRLCIEIEDLLTQAGEVQSDFVLVVCKKRYEPFKI